MPGTAVAAILACAIALALLAGAVVFAIVYMVRRRRASEAGLAAFKVVARSSTDELRAMSAEELIELHKRLDDLASNGMALTISTAEARHRVTKILAAKTPAT